MRSKEVDSWNSYQPIDLNCWMVHENTVKKDTYNTAISQYLIKGKIMKIYHYTKGISMNSIFTDGFIATERKRGLNQIHQLTDESSRITAIASLNVLSDGQEPDDSNLMA